MNIFVLNKSPQIAAEQHLDAHVVKMIIEYAQLLSTAHRLLDGVRSDQITPQGRKKMMYLLEGETVARGEWKGEPRLIIENQKCYSLSHHNHPCAIWCRKTEENYLWLFELLLETSKEFTHRYGKIHKTWKDTNAFLKNPPKNIPKGGLTEFPQAMPDEYKVHKDAVLAYQNYYLGAKIDFAKWTNRPAPAWFKARTKDYNGTDFERTSRMA